MRFALGGTDAAVSKALAGVFSQKKLPKLKISTDAVCFRRHGCRCYHALAGVFSQKKLPKLKISTDADFKLKPLYKSNISVLYR